MESSTKHTVKIVGLSSLVTALLTSGGMAGFRTIERQNMQEQAEAVRTLERSDLQKQLQIARVEGRMDAFSERMDEERIRTAELRGTVSAHERMIVEIRSTQNEMRNEIEHLKNWRNEISPVLEIDK